MIYVKINDTLYPATISGKVSDDNWDNRSSKAITLEMDYTTASNIFINGLAWSIVEQSEVSAFDENGAQIGTKIYETEYDNSDFNLAGDITDHRDGTITAKMGKLTELEEAYELMFGGN
jgi:hypothetical protein